MFLCVFQDARQLRERILEHVHSLPRRPAVNLGSLLPSAGPPCPLAKAGSDERKHSSRLVPPSSLDILAGLVRFDPAVEFFVQ